MFLKEINEHQGPHLCALESLNLVTDYEVDDQGRTIQELGPSHQIDLNGTATTIRTAIWTVYDDENHTVRVGRGYATGTSPDYEFTLINPVRNCSRAGN